MAADQLRGSRLDFSRAQILAHRRRAGALEERLAAGEDSLRTAAWVGLQDSMPRAALLSIHARVAGTGPSAWEDPSLVQLWGPRYSAYVVAAADAGLFARARIPVDVAGRRRAEELASLLHAFLDGRTMPYGEAGRALGMHGNRLRYAAATGTVRIRWDGARQPAVWTVPPPDIDPAAARLELARRYLHVFGPSTPAAFAGWLGIKPAPGFAAFDALNPSLAPARTPSGDAWILAADEASFRAPAEPTTDGARLLPSGDAYFLLQGADRQLLVPEADRRSSLWTSRVWPGAVLLSGELVGTWRRADADVTVQPWRRLTPAERTAIQAEAESLPLPGAEGRIRVRWVD